jgi:transposase InsO family protein
MNREHRVEINFGCEVTEVSRSGFYDRKDRPPSERALENAQLVEQIRAAHAKGRGVYGSPRVAQALKNDGVECSENRVAKLMSEHEIRAKQARKFKVKTTDSNHDLPIAPRVFKIEDAKAAVMAPNQVWVSDITYVPTAEGWLFLAIFLDLFTRKVVGFSTEEHMRTEMVLKALEMGIKGQNVTESFLIIHADRGVQFAATEFRSKLDDEGFIASMSRKGNCYDNAFAESFFHTLKTELVYQTEFATREEAKNAIFEYIAVFYNRERLHSGIEYLTPEQCEKLALAA